MSRAFVPLLRRHATRTTGDTHTSSADGVPIDGTVPAGRLVHITSIMGSLALVSQERNYAYSMSKASLNMFCRLLHQELAPQGVGVWAMHPGWVRTAMGGEQAHFSPEESAAGLFAQITTWRFGDPELLDFQGRALPW